MEKNTVLEYLEDRKQAFARFPEHPTNRVRVDELEVLIDWLTSQPESPAPLSAEEMVDKVREILDDELDVTTDNWGHYVGAKGKDEAASRIAALLSQRQPVAPEREEKDMDKAWMWWGSLSVEERDRVWSGYKHNSYDEKILAIWRKETYPSAENKSSHTEGDWII